MPIPLSGFKPSLRGVEQSDASGDADGTAQGLPRVLLAVSDTCPGSNAVVPKWADWIRSSPHRDYSAVVVSFDGTNHLSQLAAALASRGVHWVAMQVTQSQEFTRSSGVSVTPTVLGMDGQGHVRFVGGLFSHAERRALDEFLLLNQSASIH